MPRIVALISSATEIVHVLGQTPNQVGRSHECDFPPEVAALPVCTKPTIDIHADSREIDRAVKDRVRNALSVYDVFDDVLERLQPTHIITQTQCEVCAVSLRDVERSVAMRLASKPQIVSLTPNSLADVWDDIRRVAAAVGIEAHGEEVIASLQARMCGISEKARSVAELPRVACIEWTEPLMAGGNWTPELIAMAGGINLLGEAAKHSGYITWNNVVESDPDVIIVAPCGFDIPRTRVEMHWLTDRAEWSSMRAVRGGRVYLADGNQYFNRPGPRLVETLRIMAEILHPSVFEPRFEGVGWTRLAA
ncbi:MAG TPA: cobalamin-binding protein [Bryobacteraceae bacterium]|nr:cobalamin-binding protein [Bryobacteraceae bacterium]